MDVVGARFKNNEIYIPEVLIAARAMKMAMEVLEPELAKAGVKPIAKFLIGTVQGDLHDIGKNLVAMMLKGAGFEVIDLGVDVSPDKFAAEAKAKDVNLIGMSALLTTTMPGMEKTIKALQQAGVKAKIMVGGAPVTQELRRPDRRPRLRPRRRLGGRHGQEPGRLRQARGRAKFDVGRVKLFRHLKDSAGCAVLFHSAGLRPRMGDCFFQGMGGSLKVNGRLPPAFLSQAVRTPPPSVSDDHCSVATGFLALSPVAMGVF